MAHKNLHKEITPTTVTLHPATVTISKKGKTILICIQKREREKKNKCPSGLIH